MRGENTRVRVLQEQSLFIQETPFIALCRLLGQHVDSCELFTEYHDPTPVEEGWKPSSIHNLLHEIEIAGLQGLTHGTT